MDAVSRPTLVAACGNPMAGDDALGPQVAQAVRPMVGGEVEVVCLEMKPLALLDYLPGRRSLCLVDALHVPGQAPGVLLEFDDLEVVRFQLAQDACLSSHGLTFLQQLQLARTLAIAPPKTHLIGVTISATEMGQTIDPRVDAHVAAVAQRVARWTQRVR